MTKSPSKTNLRHDFCEGYFTCEYIRPLSIFLTTCSVERKVSAQPLAAEAASGWAETSIENFFENLRWNLTLVDFTINQERWSASHPQLHALPDVDFELMPTFWIVEGAQ